jgi:hypothetical protein
MKTQTSISRNHLRLISNRTDAQKSIPLNANIEQLSFPFEELTDVLFVKESDILRNGEFSLLLDTIKPRWLFDIRITPRLDFLANRASAFRKFNEMNLEYVDILGSVGVSSYSSNESAPEIWGTIVISALNKPSVPMKPCIFIFDNEMILKRSERVLNSLFKSTSKLSSLRIDMFDSDYLYPFQEAN